MPDEKKKPASKKTEDEKKYENLYLRALADYQNLLKQSAKEKDELAKFAAWQLIEEIIPVYDNLHMALDHARGNGVGSGGIEQGVEYVLKQLWSVLEAQGVELVETAGRAYDHNLMEAAEKAQTDDVKLDGMVAKQIKAGYMIKGKLLYPARVAVYEYAAGNGMEDEKHRAGD